MILIHTRSTDETTTDIIRWLVHYKKAFFRLNSISDLIAWYKDLKEADGFCHASFRSCYFNGTGNLIPGISEEDKELDRQLRDQLQEQAHALKVNKLKTLKIAEELGFQIPRTVIACNRLKIQELKTSWGRIIHKSMHQGIVVNTNRVLLSGQRTEEVTEDTIARMGDTFFPSLIQQLVPKQFEIRVFCFRNIIKAIAIFTQRNALTEIDGRSIDTQKPNRQVPFELPGEIKHKLRQVMERLGLNYGSFDLICTPDNEFVFLEVNPYGQYGFLSLAGNFYIEKQIAEYL
jgi:glutathione synthase/RimK-type ligase-like ATP-grasp enzyme